MNQKMMFNMDDTPPSQVLANMIHSQGKEIKSDVAKYLNTSEYRHA